MSAPLNPPQIRRVGGGFSLIELLAVMVVMAIILALVAPALLGVGKGRALDAAGNTLANLAQRARQNSLTRNAMTALVILGRAGTNADYRAAALFEIVPRADGTQPMATDWRPLGRWETFPEGIVIDLCSFTDAALPISPALPAPLFRGVGAAHYQYVVFMPGGALLRSDPARARLVQGFWNPGAQSASLQGPRNAQGGPANFYDVSILGATGRVKIDRP